MNKLVSSLTFPAYRLSFEIKYAFINQVAFLWPDRGLEIHLNDNMWTLVRLKNQPRREYWDLHLVSPCSPSRCSVTWHPDRINGVPYRGDIVSKNPNWVTSNGNVQRPVQRSIKWQPLGIAVNASTWMSKSNQPLNKQWYVRKASTNRIVVNSVGVPTVIATPLLAPQQPTKVPTHGSLR